MNNIMKKILKNVLIYIILFLFLIYILLNIFSFGFIKNWKLQRPIIETYYLDKSIISTVPYYSIYYFIVYFSENFLNELEKQNLLLNENVNINFYFLENEVFVETNILNNNYNYHFYLM